MSHALAGVRPVLVLWDVDHTLIENNGVNKETYARAFELLTGSPAQHRAQTDGRTDPEIMRDLLARHGIEPESYAARIPEVLVKAMGDNAENLRERGHELPGAREALESLGKTPGVYQSVLSGNIKPNALTKLSVFDLAKYLDFDIGGYGSDDSVRANLVPIARDRASAKLKLAFTKSDTVVIGDTPRDVQAGQNGGAYVIGVASGSDSMDVLSAEGADAVLPDLRNTHSLVSLVRNFQG